MNVGQNTTLGDSDVAKKLIQFLVVPDSKLQMAGNDTGLFVVAGSITGKFEDLSRKVFENSCEVDRCTWFVLEDRAKKQEAAKQTDRHQHAERSCPSSTDGERDRQGKQDQPWMIA